MQALYHMQDKIILTLDAGFIGEPQTAPPAKDVVARTLYFAGTLIINTINISIDDSILKSHIVYNILRPLFYLNIDKLISESD